MLFLQCTPIFQREERRKMPLKHLFLLLICGMVINATAQSLLLPEEAVQQVLQRNLQLEMERKNQAAAEVVKTPGNAGFLPSLQVNSGYTLQSIDLKQEFSNGLQVDRSGVGSSNMQASLGLQWALFDGGRMFHNWHRLQEEAQMAGYAFRDQAGKVVSTALLAYFEIVQLQQQLKAFQAGLETADQQLLVSRTRFESGSATRQELLQAEIDRNVWTVLIIKEKSNIRSAKIKLNELLVREVDTEFSVIDSLPAFYNQFISSAAETPDLSENPGLLYAASSKRLAALAVSSLKADFYPRLMLNAGYQFGRTNSEGGFALFNRSIGPAAGLGITWNIFNGGVVKTSLRHAGFMEEKAGLAFRSQELALKAAYKMAKIQLEDQLQISALEALNMSASRQNMELALEQFRLGKSDMTALKEAQRSYQESISRLSAAKRSALAAEIELLRISGKLIR